MRVVIAGSRTVTDYSVVSKAIEDSGFSIDTVVSGGAQGVDALGEAWAKANGVDLVIIRADWDAHGKAAGPIRNKRMAAYGEALIAVWDGVSRGTKNMVDEAEARGLKVYIARVE